MQLHALTAGTALILVQLCVALVMAGIFFAMPSEKCTRYWAFSGLLIAIGVLTVVLNNGAMRPAILILGNNSLQLGLILQWCGIREFYKKPRSYAGWWIGAAFFVSFSLLVLRQAPVSSRALLAALGILAMLILYFHEIWTGQRGRHTFAGMLGLGGVGLLVIGYSARVAATALKPDQFLPGADATPSIILIYLVPLVGGIVLAAALLLLYFERMVAEKHHLATHDDLTGMLNRRAIVAGGEREVAIAARLRRPMAVAFVDIDHFKQINDTLGHEAGDQVLAEVAQVLRQACRNIDLVGRYGGEEFCIVLPGLEQDSIAALGQRMVAAVREHRFGNGVSVTVSIGLAALPPGDAGLTWVSLIRRADMELYKSKVSGRDRFSVAAGAAAPAVVA